MAVLEMKRIWTGLMQFTPYRPWSEERKAARREGRRMTRKPMPEFVNPYPLALPAPPKTLLLAPPRPVQPGRLVINRPAGVTLETKAYFKADSAALRRHGMLEQAEQIDRDIARLEQLAIKFGFVCHTAYLPPLDTGSMT
jgi:hypothetical protein